MNNSTRDAAQRMTNALTARVFLELAEVIKETQVAGVYIGPYEEWQPDVAATLQLLAQRLQEKATELTLEPTDKT